MQVFDYMNMYLSNKSARNIRKALIEKVRSYQPHLVHLQIQHTSVIDANTIQTIKKDWPKIKISNWTGDVRAYVPVTYKRIAMIADYNFISSTGQLPMFEGQLKKKIKYLQIGYNPSLYYPDRSLRRNFKFDISFVGHHNTREKYPGAITRTHACKLLQATFNGRFGLFGHGWPRGCTSLGSIAQKEVAKKVYHNSLSVLSISHFNDISHYFSDRLLMCMASGRPTICLKFPNWETYFTHMCDLVIVDDIREIPDAVKKLKKDPDLADYIGRSGSAKVFAEHTYDSRVAELLFEVGLK